MRGHKKHTLTKPRLTSAKLNGARLPDLRRVRKNLVGLTQNIKHSSADTAHDAATYVNGRVNSLKSSGIHRLKRAQKRIQSKPGQSVALAFTAGLLTSLLVIARRVS